jgi:uncharacterized protein
VHRAEFLRLAGYSTLLIDFQGTGESAGEAITFGWLECFDVLAAVNYLKGRLPDERVGVIGLSLGGTATLLATPPLEIDSAVWPGGGTVVIWLGAAHSPETFSLT